MYSNFSNTYIHCLCLKPAFIFFLQRTYAERIRGEARKKWLQQIITAAETGGASIDPVYKAVFQALYKVNLLHYCTVLTLSIWLDRCKQTI